VIIVSLIRDRDKRVSVTLNLFICAVMVNHRVQLRVVGLGYLSVVFCWVIFGIVVLAWVPPSSSALRRLLSPPGDVAAIERALGDRTFVGCFVGGRWPRGIGGALRRVVGSL
jgi:hypothetical protein